MKAFWDWLEEEEEEEDDDLAAPEFVDGIVETTLIGPEKSWLMALRQFATCVREFEALRPSSKCVNKVADAD